MSTDLRLDEPLSEDDFAYIQKWYEDEVSDAPYASKHDCLVVRALRELAHRRQAFCPTHGIHGCTHPAHWGPSS